MYCNKCGKKIHNSDVFCPKCGFRIPQIEKDTFDSYFEEIVPVKATRKKRVSLKLLIGIPALIIVICLGVFLIPLVFQPSLEKIEKSVVTVYCYDKNGEFFASGSGFIVYDNSTFLTNYHVIEGAYSVAILIDDEELIEADYIEAGSKEKDIAFLHLEERTKLIPLKLGNSDKVEKGEHVIAIGSPLGISNVVSDGLISGMLWDDEIEAFSISAPISHGSSGGALFNDRHEVIGITYAGFDEGQNLNLAIPINEAIELYKQGVTKQPLRKYLDPKYDIPEVFISSGGRIKYIFDIYEGKVTHGLFYSNGDFVSEQTEPFTISKDGTIITIGEDIFILDGSYLIDTDTILEGSYVNNDIVLNNIYRYKPSYSEDVITYKFWDKGTVDISSGTMRTSGVYKKVNNIVNIQYEEDGISHKKSFYIYDGIMYVYYYIAQ